MRLLRVKRGRGIAYAIISGMSFGFIPLFTLQAVHEGYTTFSILTYRFGISALLFGAMLLIQRVRVHISPRQLLELLALSVLCYGGSAYFLVQAYHYIPSGIATTINFLFPVIVALIMRFVYGEHLRWLVWAAIALSLLGVGMLSWSDGGVLNLRGISYAMGTAVCYGLYVVGLNKLTVRSLPGRIVTFFVLLFTAIFFFTLGVVHGGITPIGSTEILVDFVLLALVATMISNYTLVLSVQSIGSTMASVLGSVEPLTALGIGVFLLGESLTAVQVLGAVVVVLSVALVVVGNKPVDRPPDTPIEEPGVAALGKRKGDCVE